MSSLPIANLLNQELLVAPFTNIINDMGDAGYGVPVRCRCRIDFGRSLVYGLDGTSVPSVATIYTDSMVGARDKMMIPFGDDPSGRNVVPNRIDFMSIDRDALLGNGWNIEGEYLTRVPIGVKTLYDRNGKFSHCEVAV